ncbi:MAG: hypothetical protein JO316_10250 [Abitibacteriaceae bacterium]|nr:hypothetical protein [Abditibacteriaceae bacterium]
MIVWPFYRLKRLLQSIYLIEPTDAILLINPINADAIRLNYRKSAIG